MATVHKCILENGQEVNMSLSFRKLAVLSKKNPDAYKHYNNVILNGAKNEMDMISILYAAYLCENEDAECTFKEFIDLVPEDRSYFHKVFGEVYGTGKKPRKAL